MERLADHVNSIDDIPIELKLGYLGTDESLVLYPLPGSRVAQEYMNGAKDWNMNYEIAMKSKMQSKIHHVLWTLQNDLEQLEDLESHDGSFDFEELIVTNKPFINQIDEQGWFVFLLGIQAKITVFKGDD